MLSWLKSHFCATQIDTTIVKLFPIVRLCISRLTSRNSQIHSDQGRDGIYEVCSGTAEKVRMIEVVNDIYLKQTALLMVVASCHIQGIERVSYV